MQDFAIFQSLYDTINIFKYPPLLDLEGVDEISGYYTTGYPGSVGIL